MTAPSAVTEIYMPIQVARRPRSSYFALSTSGQCNETNTPELISEMYLHKANSSPAWIAAHASLNREWVQNGIPFHAWMERAFTPERWTNGMLQVFSPLMSLVPVEDTEGRKLGTVSDFFWNGPGLQYILVVEWISGKACDALFEQSQLCDGTGGLDARLSARRTLTGTGFHFVPVAIVIGICQDPNVVQLTAAS